MAVHYISAEKSYIQVLSDYILNIYSQKCPKGDYSSLTIYLPNFKSCRILQENIMYESKGETIILPNITTFKESLVSINHARLNSDSLSISNNLEQQLILADIINNYREFNYSFIQSFNLAKSLASTLQELCLYQIDITKIEDIYAENKSEHIQKMQNFLVYSQLQWNDYLDKFNKVDMTEEYLKLLNKKLIELNNVKSEVIIILTNLKDPLIKKLCKLAQNNNLLKIILPSIPQNFFATTTKIDNISISPFFKNLVKSYSIDLNKTQKFSTEIDYSNIEFLIEDNIDKREAALNSIFFGAQTNRKILIEGLKGIKYIEVKNISEEATIIGSIIKYYYNMNGNESIYVVTNNSKLTNLIEVFLNRFNLSFEQGKENTNSINTISFLIAILELASNNFDVTYLLKLLKHPFYFYSHSALIAELEIKCFRGFNNYNDQTSLYNKIKQSCDAFILNWFEKLISILAPLTNLLTGEKIRLDEGLIAIVNTAEKLTDNLWKTSNKKIGEQINVIIEAATNVKPLNKEDFLKLLKSLLNSLDIRSAEKWRPKIAAIRSKDIFIVGKNDLVILADLNENSWPKLSLFDPWLGDKLRTQLRLPDKAEQISEEYLQFFIALNCKNTYITRSTKSKGSETTASRFLLKFIANLENNNVAELINPSINWLSILDMYLTANQVIKDIDNNYYAKGEHFPVKLAVTNLELLMRNPHAFYAKKILKLEKLLFINADVTARDFGIFLHNVIEKYFTNYHVLEQDKLKQIFTIALGVIKAMNFSEDVINLWWPKFSNMIKAFIDYDEGCRSSGNKIYVEIQGAKLLTVAKKNITLTAKADRIEQNYDNTFTIIDFKTGIVPSARDIKLGISPQLLVESYLLSTNGFKQINNKCLTKTKTIIKYIKFSASPPYLHEYIINIDFDINSFAAKGISKLIEYYVQDTASYPACPDEDIAPNYNDYKHLARII